MNDIAMNSPDRDLEITESSDQFTRRSDSFEFVKSNNIREEIIILKPMKRPPSQSEVKRSLSQHNLSETQNKDAFFSCDKDLADKTR